MSAPATTTSPPISGLQPRPYRREDAAIVAELHNRGDAEETAAWFDRVSDHFDAARDVEIVELDGVPVAFVESEWIDTTDGIREYRMGAMVDPDWRRRGIGRWLQRRLEAHARVLAALYPSDQPAAAGSWVPDAREGARILLEQEGFTPARYFFDMVRPTMDDIQHLPLPDGLEIRPVGPDAYRQLWDADAEAFLDHWGGFDASDAAFQAWLKDPRFEPSLFVVAWDGDQIAGGVINQINETENAAFNRKRGWLQSVFTRRPWRQRGVASALVAHSLELLRDRGMTSAGLGVDADNPNSATRLYEKAGFELDFRSTAYRKPMEMGR
jgi:GNAT superfamily N-acetyltransferase